MDRENMINELLRGFIETKLQELSFTVSDMINQHMDDRVFLLVTMQNVVDSILPQLSEPEQNFFKLLRERTVTITLPREMDPRKHDGK